MLYTAVNLNCPVAIRYPRGSGLGISIDRHLQQLSIGNAQQLNAGKDVIFFAVGVMVEPCRKASELLGAQKAPEAGVINARFIKPLDEEMIRRLSWDADD